VDAECRVLGSCKTAPWVCGGQPSLPNACGRRTQCCQRPQMRKTIRGTRSRTLSPRRTHLGNPLLLRLSGVKAIRQPLVVLIIAASRMAIKPAIICCLVLAAVVVSASSAAWVTWIQRTSITVFKQTTPLAQAVHADVSCKVIKRSPVEDTGAG
jgi:hypothetical protein